ncbi:hypothetical protein NC99_37230 [Sunxiuqinia dokdonensis]|uniref:Uncharacterized protein n=1 Tax=Sunxiuqinia dokdonensis TaxID=1409788 RepID=A0A0L8V4S9_9BACT|nr:hypothetical protein NC99_37230 [Sunxiuqinia dokdonensis]
MICFWVIFVQYLLLINGQLITGFADVYGLDSASFYVLPDTLNR